MHLKLPFSYKEIGYGGFVHFLPVAPHFVLLFGFFTILDMFMEVSYDALPLY